MGSSSSTTKSEKGTSTRKPDEKRTTSNNNESKEGNTSRPDISEPPHNSTEVSDKCNDQNAEHGTSSNIPRDSGEGKVNTNIEHESTEKVQMNGERPTNDEQSKTQQNSSEEKMNTHTGLTPIEDPKGKEQRRTHDEQTKKELVRESKKELGDLVKKINRTYVNDTFSWPFIDKWYIQVDEKKTKMTDETSHPLMKKESRREELMKSQQEKSRLLHRLSEIASTRLRANNPDIADLSDPNRATKLAEKLSEIYDNEWTDTYEEIKAIKNTKIDDKVLVSFLRDVLQYCDGKSTVMACQQRQRLFHSLNMSENKDDNFKNCGPELQLKLQEIQKGTSHWSILHVQKVTKVDIVNQFNKHLWQPFGNDASKVKNLVKEAKKKPYHHLQRFINTCVDVTWYMQIQDPPTKLLFSPPDGIEPLAQFRAYTVSGKSLNYVLWPAMLLYENGPMVSKGVAQFIKDTQNIKTNETENKTVKDSHAEDRKVQDTNGEPDSTVKSPDSEW